VPLTRTHALPMEAFLEDNLLQPWAVMKVPEVFCYFIHLEDYIDDTFMVCGNCGGVGAASGGYSAKIRDLYVT
jgi:hypothetical protein